MTRYIPPPPAGRRRAAQATTLARDAFGREIATVDAPSETEPPVLGGDPEAAPRQRATDALGRRAGALSDEIDFPAFVASLVHGTFDAIVDSSIKQMESFADLVSAVAKPLDQFAQENVTLGQARAWLVEQFPRDVTLVEASGEYLLAPLVAPGGEELPSPAWLADFGQEGNELSAELLEETLLPQARDRVARQRLSTLSTMVLLGMQRVVVKDGSVGARLRFRAAAVDRAAVQYATSNDPETGGSTWVTRGQTAAITKVSTVGINAQSDSELKAELFGDVKINFASETLPLDRFADEARRTLLERHSRQAPAPRAAVPAPPAASAAPVTTVPETTPGPGLAPVPPITSVVAPAPTGGGA
ncbi:hypothetical protein [Cellulomonas humilata]|uniref:Uncharacterized protein n=1 Tax=Cellulomonas humilata TaxID=144055 RepID=A0ABU0EGI0_9CELL|nr:hypothetical protein [Cellulomonas humilata]MDQ0373927.1 hypothetical protein [Cellulomonas humilata]